MAYKKQEYDIITYTTVSVFYKNGRIKEKINRNVYKNAKLGTYILYGNRRRKVEYAKNIGWNFTI